MLPRTPALYFAILRIIEMRREEDVQITIMSSDSDSGRHVGSGSLSALFQGIEQMGRNIFYGKTLPVVFVYGYMYSFQVIMGRSNVTSYYQIIAQEVFSEQNGKVYTIEALDQYFGIAPGIPQDMDYGLLSFLQQGLRKAFASKENRVVVITRRVGRMWWYGDAPVSPYQDRQSLHYLLSPTIRDHLDRHKFGAFDINHSSVKSSTELVRMGIQLLIEELARQSGIDCRLQYADERLEIVIDTCPFCLGTSPFCHVFVGLVEAFVDWLHGMHQANALVTTMNIDEQATTGHFIVLNPTSR